MTSKAHSLETTTTTFPTAMLTPKDPGHVKIRRIPKPKLFRSNPHKLITILINPDSDTYIDDDGIIIGRRRTVKVEEEKEHEVEEEKEDEVEEEKEDEVEQEEDELEQEEEEDEVEQEEDEVEQEEYEVEEETECKSIEETGIQENTEKKTVVKIEKPNITIELKKMEA